MSKPRTVLTEAIADRLDALALKLELSREVFSEVQALVLPEEFATRDAPEPTTARPGTVAKNNAMCRRQRFRLPLTCYADAGPPDEAPAEQEYVAMVRLKAKTREAAMAEFRKEFGKSGRTYQPTNPASKRGECGLPMNVSIERV